MAPLAFLRHRSSRAVGWFWKLREICAPHHGCRLLSRLQQHLLNGTAEGYWNLLADPPTKFNFSRDVIDFWSTEEKKNSQSNSAFYFAVDDNPKLDITFSYTELASLSKRVSGFLKDQCGLCKGDRLMVILPKTP